MHIVAFEDHHVSRLYPITVGRPSYAISCGSFRLVDWLSRSAREANAALAQGDALLAQLDGMGAFFGFTDMGSSYCGVTFMGLLIVDVAAHKIYEVMLTGSGSC